MIPQPRKRGPCERFENSRLIEVGPGSGDDLRNNLVEAEWQPMPGWLSCNPVEGEAEIRCREARNHLPGYELSVREAVAVRRRKDGKEFVGRQLPRPQRRKRD